MKTPKGCVAVENSKNRLRLRWSCEGKRYCLSLGLTYNLINLKLAQKTANQIELDIASGNFDSSLDKYGHKQTTPAKAAKQVSKDQLLPLWDKWVLTLGLAPRTLNAHYRAIRRTLRRQSHYLLMLPGMKPLIAFPLASLTTI